MNPLCCDCDHQRWGVSADGDVSWETCDKKRREYFQSIPCVEYLKRNREFWEGGE